LTPAQGGLMGTKRAKQPHKDGAIASQDPFYFELEETSPTSRPPKSETSIQYHLMKYRPLQRH